MEPGRDAWDLLKRVWMTEGPAGSSLPVDPFDDLAAGSGSRSGPTTSCAPDVSGILRKEADFKNPEIFLNDARPP